MTIELIDGIKIKVSENPSYDIAKLDNAPQILEADVRLGVKYIDLRFKDIVVKKK